MIIEEVRVKTIQLESEEINTFDNLFIKLYNKSREIGFKKYFQFTKEEIKMIRELTGIEPNETLDLSNINQEHIDE